VAQGHRRARGVAVRRHLARSRSPWRSQPVRPQPRVPGYGARSVRHRDRAGGSQPQARSRIPGTRRDGHAGPPKLLPASSEVMTSTPRGGWHWREWLSEFAGTALLLLGGLSGLFLTFGPRAGLARAIPSESIRLLLTGVILALTGLAVTVSPLGRSSGAH